MENLTHHDIMIQNGYIESKQFILDYMPENSIGLEIGVWKGTFSKFINSNKQLSHFYLCDPWSFQPEFPQNWYGGAISKEQKDMDAIYESVNNEFKDFTNVSIIRDYSSNLLNHLEINSLDWVYIDGNHAYEYVIQDLEISFNLVKPQGFIFGDDYVTAHPGVIKAFKEFLEKYKNKVEKVELKNSQIVIKKL